MTPLAVLLALVVLLAGCGQPPPAPSPSEARLTPSPSPSPAAAATPDPALSVAARSAYTQAICPIFLRILEMDPRLATLRAEGAADVEPSVHAVEIEAVGGDLRVVLNDLEALPDWGPGRHLRTELIVALHRVRSAVLDVAADPGAPDGAARMAAIPYLASDSMDLAMRRAADGGLSCDWLDSG